MPEFGLVRSFDIDNGELDGLSPQQIFVLGYELGEIDRLLDTENTLVDPVISRPVHAANEQRIRKACDDASVIEAEPGRQLEKGEYSLTWCHDDGSESWMEFSARP